jgi:5'-nucleotidase
VRLIITNDDGYQAEGIAVLAEVARRFGTIDVVAPLTVQSQTSHAVSLTRPIALHTIEDGRLGRVVAVDGRPADCPRVALAGLEGLERPDWVLSGINHGANLGVDLLYSGTVAAAREAALNGVPAIAVSQLIMPPQPIDWAGAAVMAERAVGEILARGTARGTFWNVNLPAVTSGFDDVPIVGVPIAWDPLPLVFEPIAPPADDGGAQQRDQGRYYQYVGRYADRPRGASTDVESAFGGEITITRVAVHER